MDYADLIPTLPTEQRLALAYAPAASRPRFLALLALDARLAAITREGREPALLQLRMAWWRDLLGRSPNGGRPADLLHEAILSAFPDPRELVPLVDAWEALAVVQPAERPVSELASVRALLFARCGPPSHSTDGERAAREWALADLAARLKAPKLRMESLELTRTCAWQRIPLPAELRPLAVLHALARHSHDGAPLLKSPIAFLRAVRVGLLGT